MLSDKNNFEPQRKHKQQLQKEMQNMDEYKFVFVAAF